jgi:hypothetical protein
MTEEEQVEAATYMKLVDDVKKLIVETVVDELRGSTELRAECGMIAQSQIMSTDRYGPMATTIKRVMLEQLSRN